MASKRRKAANTAVSPAISKEGPPLVRWFFGNGFGLLRRHGGTIGFWVGLGYIVRQISLVFVAFAGKESNANLVFNLMSNINFVFTGSIALSGISVSFYLRERR